MHINLHLSVKMSSSISLGILATRSSIRAPELKLEELYKERNLETGDYLARTDRLKSGLHATRSFDAT